MADSGAATVRVPSQRLALILQETLTAIARIRAGREIVPNMEGFRAQVMNALQVAEEEARRAGYAGNDVRMAAYAAVALLDESVFASSNPVFREWGRRPLGPEWFAGHVAGETFFNHVKELLMADDSHRTAELLEVHLLCLLLGYRGRYGSDRDGDLRAIEDRIAEKIRRIRGEDPRLSPRGLPGAERTVSSYDPWTRWLTGVALALLIAAVVLFVVYKMSIGSGITTLAQTTAAAESVQA